MNKKENKSSLESRRSFLKKAGYSVPTILALGSLVDPIKAHAGKPKPGDNSKIKPKNF